MAAVVKLPGIRYVLQSADISVILMRHALCISDIVIQSFDLPAFSKILSLYNTQVRSELVELISPSR
jgi:hypothetical protein